MIKKLTYKGEKYKLIYNQNLFLNLGIQLHDTCGSIRLTQRHLFQIITATREPNNVLTLPEFTQGPGGRSSFSLGPPLLGKFYDLKCCYITPQ